MPEFKPRDKIISDKYGPGRVTSEASVTGCVDVAFDCGEYDCIYNKFTGKRYLTIGHDTIRHQEGENGNS